MSEKQLKQCIACSEFKPGKISRGLCTTCYKQFQRELLEIDEQYRDAFEQELIEAKKLLPKSENPFREIAEKYKSPGFKQEAAKVIKDIKKPTKKR